MTEHLPVSFHPRFFFSAECATIEQAQALHEYELFNCAAVFQTPTGFVYGLLREMDSLPHWTARAIREVCGYRMVSYHGPLINRWREYQEGE